MATPVEAARQALQLFPLNAGAFYGAATGLSLGAGLVYSNVIYPLFNEGDGLFDTVAGTALVLTHECDADTSNDRAFNLHVLVCPIIPFDIWVERYDAEHGVGGAGGLIPHLVNDNVYRVQYLPPIPTRLSAALPYGGLMYLNQISHAPVATFSEHNKVCALSQHGLRAVDYKFTNHFFRPKAEALPRLQ